MVAFPSRWSELKWLKGPHELCWRSDLPDWSVWLKHGGFVGASEVSSSSFSRLPSDMASFPHPFTSIPPSVSVVTQHSFLSACSLTPASDLTGNRETAQ